MRIGTRAQVFHGTAKQTSGGLRRSDLKKNKRGAIVSRRASSRAKKENRLVKAGYVTQKGKFGVVQRGGTKEFSKLEVGDELKFNVDGDNMELKVETHKLTEVVGGVEVEYYMLLTGRPERPLFYLFETKVIKEFYFELKEVDNVPPSVYFNELVK